MSDDAPTVGIAACPFCGGTFVMDGGEDASVMHTLPACATFDRMDGLDFLLAASRAMGLPLDVEAVN